MIRLSESAWAHRNETHANKEGLAPCHEKMLQHCPVALKVSARSLREHQRDSPIDRPWSILYGVTIRLVIDNLLILWMFLTL